MTNFWHLISLSGAYWLNAGHTFDSQMPKLGDGKINQGPPHVPVDPNPPPLPKGLTLMVK